jgi:hypothetical protein
MVAATGSMAGAGTKFWYHSQACLACFQAGAPFYFFANIL